MKKFLFVLLTFCCLHPDAVIAQDKVLPQNFLFDDSDIIVTAAEEPEEKTPSGNNDEAAAEAVSSARSLLEQRPVKLRQKTFPQFKSKAIISAAGSDTLNKTAPFGLIWGSDIPETRSQGVKLAAVDMKDYVNSFLASNLPKAIDFFERVYVVYGRENKLYRILAYSRLIDDDASASKALTAYNTYSELLNKKYGNKEEDFTPAVISKTVKNSQGRNETVKEDAPIGNPEFLSQLQAGTAVLYSTYYNNNVAAALSIGVDGDKKSYIVIDYKNLSILEKQEAETLDAL